MDNDKSFGFQNLPSGSGSEGGDAPAPRARNRTVMLTPEITGQVRARLAHDNAEGTSQPVEPAHLGSGYAAQEQSSGFTAVGRSTRANTEAPMGRPAALAAPLPEPVVSAGGAVWVKKTPVVGFLVSFDSNPNGDVYELRSGRVIVTSEATGSGNFFVIHDETVSPMHAILRVSASGEVQVLDQLSEAGTRIKRIGNEQEIELLGEKGSLEHGDVVRFGKRNFHVCIIQVANTI
jgi:hypothetical protein